MAQKAFFFHNVLLIVCLRDTLVQHDCLPQHLRGRKTRNAIFVTNDWATNFAVLSQACFSALLFCFCCCHLPVHEESVHDSVTKRIYRQFWNPKEIFSAGTDHRILSSLSVGKSERSHTNESKDWCGSRIHTGVFFKISELSYSTQSE